MAGGLFALDRKFFFELGGFDEKMEFWGGENIEMSMRLWMCGGTLELVPCSRVAHIFGGFPNPHRCASGAVHGGVNYNKWRAIRSWMQPKHIKIFEKMLSSPSDIGSLDNMFAIKKRLKCKNFDWFLENVWPESWILKVLNAQANGSLRNKATQQCIGSTDGSLSSCGRYGFKIFHSREDQFMVWKLGDLDNCLASANYGSMFRKDVRLTQEHCQYSDVTSRQQFKRNSKGQYVHSQSSSCLTVNKKLNRVQLRKCDSESDPALQQWEFVFPKV